MRNSDVCRQCKERSLHQPCSTCFIGIEIKNRELWDKIDAVEKTAREILKRLDGEK